MTKYKAKEPNCKCCICDKPIYRTPSKLKALVDGKPVCSRKCNGIKKTRKHTKNNFECAVCGKGIYKAPYEVRNSKTGEFVCSKEHYSELQSIRNRKKIEKRLGIDDFKGWLYEKYHVEQMNSREISEVVYGTKGNGPNIIGWMERLGVPRRSGGEAIALQWEKDPERRKLQAELAVEYMGAGTPSREKLIKTMQTDEYKARISRANSGERNGMYGATGEKNPNWNPNLTEEDRLHSRKYPEYEKWRKEVYERDNYTCQKCKSKRGGDLVAHHINGYHWDKDSRIEVDNGATLCEPCHKEFHATYGYGDNDLFQFAQFMDLTLTK